VAIGVTGGEVSKKNRAALSEEAQPYQDFIDPVLFAMAGLAKPSLGLLCAERNDYRHKANSIPAKISTRPNPMISSTVGRVIRTLPNFPKFMEIKARLQMNGSVRCIICKGIPEEYHSVISSNSRAPK
jgi:hypothetical protein